MEIAMRLVLLFALLSVMATAAQADDSPALRTLLFGHAIEGKDSGYACFSRVYDPAHLKAHPKQNVTEALMLLKGAYNEDAPTSLQYMPMLDFKFRNSKKHFQATGDCSSVAAEGAGVKMSCGVDCDGGTINVTLKDPDTVLVALPNGVAVTGPGKNDEPSYKHFGSDDTVFKLTRTTLPNCMPLASEDEDKAALKKAP